MNSTNNRVVLEARNEDLPHGRERADRWLTTRAAMESTLFGREVARSQIVDWFARDLVQRAGVPLRASAKISVGDKIEIEIPPPSPTHAIPQDIALDVLFVDEHIVVVNKVAGMVVHPAAGHPDGTLVNALLHRFGELANDDTDGDDEAPSFLRPGIVHRLDKGTSGVMIVARTSIARTALMHTFAKHDLEREYVAIAEGSIADSRVLQTLHGRDPRDRKKFSTRVKDGKSAITHLFPEQHTSFATRVRCRLETGRTHQIRVQLADFGHPLLGDPLYGRVPKDETFARIHHALGRQALHAEVLQLAHPVSKQIVRFSAPAPADFEVAWQALRSLHGTPTGTL